MKHINLYQTIMCHIPENSNLNIVIGIYGCMLFVSMTCEKVSEKCHGNEHIQTLFEKEGCLKKDSIINAILYKKW